MKTTRATVILTIITAFGLALQFGHASARGLMGGPTFWLSCENGAKYTIHARAVSHEGDMVTGQLMTRQRQGMHIRLIPMGFGYRYAGRGAWFDGERETVYLYFSKYRPIACTLARGPDRARG